MAGQRDSEGRRRSGVWLPDECWDWLTANTAPGLTRSDLIEGLVLLAMDEQADTKEREACPV